MGQTMRTTILSALAAIPLLAAAVVPRGAEAAMAVPAASLPAAVAPAAATAPVLAPELPGVLTQVQYYDPYWRERQRRREYWRWQRERERRWRCRHGYGCY